jgi:hypothetical protein
MFGSRWLGFVAQPWWLGPVAAFVWAAACAHSSEVPAGGEPSLDGSDGATSDQVSSDSDAATAIETGGFDGDQPLDACAGSLEKAGLIPLDLYFMLDTSGSMMTTYLEPMKAGIVNFLADPKSVGLGVTGQQFPFPKNGEPNIDSCDALDYASPTITWGVAPAPNFSKWVGNLKSNGGETPSVAALTGAIDACFGRMTDQPGHKCSVIFVTDGQPFGECKPDQQDALEPLKELAAKALSRGIRVYAIGFPNLESFGIQVLNGIASNGGTEAPVIIESNDAGDAGVGEQLITSLNEIRWKALGCEFQMPVAEGGTLDPGLVNVQYRPDPGSDLRTLVKRASEQDCGTQQGWYYDSDSHPTKLIMCPATCTDLQQIVTANEIQIQVGCAQVVR